MDRLHGVLKTLGVDTKSARKRASLNHLGVFREFLNHLDRIQQAAPARPPRPRVPRRAPKRVRKG